MRVLTDGSWHPRVKEATDLMLKKRLGCEVVYIDLDKEITENIISDEVDFVLATTDRYMEYFDRWITLTPKKPERIYWNCEDTGRLRYVDFEVWKKCISTTPHHLYLPVTQKAKVKEIIFPEFDLEPYREYKPLPEKPCLANFLLILTDDLHYDCDMYTANIVPPFHWCPQCKSTQVVHVHVKQKSIWNEVVEQLTNWDAVSYGSDCGELNHYFSYGPNGERIDGIPSESIPKAHQNSLVMYHYKAYEGYGFAFMESLAAGRPVLSDWSWWRYKAVGQLLRYGENFLHASHEVNEIVKVLTEWRAKGYEWLNKISERQHAVFHASVDFAWETEKLKRVLYA